MPKKSAIVTNACDYAGPAAVAALLDAAYHVSASDQRFTSSAQRRTFDAVNRGAEAFVSDTPEELVAAVLAARGQIDMIVSNDIAKPNAGPVEEAGPQTLRGLFEDLAVAPMRLVAAAAPSLKAQRSGSVVLITSSGNLWPRAGYALYSAARAAANTMVRAWGKEFGPYGVSVNAIAPNFLDNEYYVPSAESNPAYHQRMSELVPFGRFGRQDELSALIRFLAAGDSPFVSGQIIGFNGGWG